MSEILIPLWQTLKQVLQCLFTCPHSHVQVTEGKTYCPDCGQGVLFRWAVLKCGDCHQRRGAHYRFRQIMPDTRCCTGCGSARLEKQILIDPEFFQVRHALLDFETVREDAFRFSRLSVTVSTYWENLMTPSGGSGATGSSLQLLQAG